MIDQLERRILSEWNNEVDTLERGKHVRTIGFSSDRARRALEAPNGCIGVHANDQDVTRCSRCREEVDVTGMQKIEHTIGENDPALVLSPPSFRLRPRRDFSRRITRLQSRLLTDG